MSFSEMVVLARATVCFGPRRIFEIGTYNGLTTAIFILNSKPDTQIFTLDLPEDATTAKQKIESDGYLISTRRIGSVPKSLGLTRYEQIFCDSLMFDPRPYRHSIDLALIDGAHDLQHAQTDTTKIASMMSEQGIVFWHDYGGRGAFGPLSSYLENLASKAPIYRIPDTSLAWTEAKSLRTALDKPTWRRNKLSGALQI